MTANTQKVLATILKQATPKLDLRLLASEALKRFGGYPGLAQHLKNAFDHNADGSANQVRILSDVVKLIFQSQDLSDDGDMDEDTMKSQLEILLRQMDEDGPDDE